MATTKRFLLLIILCGSISHALGQSNIFNNYPGKFSGGYCEPYEKYWIYQHDICPKQDNLITVFEDDFNVLDKNKWATTYEWGTTLGGALNIMTDDDVWVEDGLLHLRARHNPGFHPDFDYDENGVFIGTKLVWAENTSGMIRLKANFLSGYFEIRCKIPKINASWPAFWLFGECLQEIDVFEFWRKNGWSQTEASSRINVTTHLGRKNECTNATKASWAEIYYSPEDLSDSFHTYAVEWDQQFLTFYLDGIEIGRQHRYHTQLSYSPIDCNSLPGEYWFNPYYPRKMNSMQLIISTAVFPDYQQNITSQGETMIVDYVKIKQRASCESSWQLCQNSDYPVTEDHFHIAKTISIDENCDYILDQKISYFGAFESIDISNNFETTFGISTDFEINDCFSGNYPQLFKDDVGSSAYLGKESCGEFEAILTEVYNANGQLTFKHFGKAQNHYDINGFYFVIQYNKTGQTCASKYYSF